MKESDCLEEWTRATTATAANVGQVGLTAGDWDVYCSGVFAGAVTTVTSDVRLGLNSTSATMPSATALQFFQFRNAAGITDFIYVPTVGPWRVSLSGSQTWFCVGQATLTTSTFSVTGTARARGVR